MCSLVLFANAECAIGTDLGWISGGGPRITKISILCTLPEAASAKMREVVRASGQHRHSPFLPEIFM